MKMITIHGSTKYWIIKPVDEDWSTAGALLAKMQRANARALNYCLTYYFADKALNNDHADFPLRQNVKEICPDFSSNIIDEIIQVAFDSWQRYQKELGKGMVRSLSSFRQDFPIEIRDRGLKLLKQDDNYLVDVNLLSKENDKRWFRFVIHPSMDKKKDNIKVGTQVLHDYSRKSKLDKLLQGEYETDNCQIFKDNKRGSWYIRINYRFQQSMAARNPDIIIGCDLGYNSPFALAVSNSKSRKVVFEYNELIRKKANYLNMMRRQILRAGKANIHIRGGHGRKRKLLPIVKWQDKYVNFRKYINNVLSKMVVIFALKHNAGIIVIEDLSGLKQQHNSYFLKYWPIFELQAMIENKAKSYGIIVIKVIPDYSSQRCSECGTIDKGNRNGKNYKCSCGFDEDADYNAARNLIHYYLTGKITDKTSKRGDFPRPKVR